MADYYIKHIVLIIIIYTNNKYNFIKEFLLVLISKRFQKENNIIN
jgi:hypothetical protein